MRQEQRSFLVKMAGRKGAIGHIEIIVAFIIFVGFLVFLFYIFNPFKKSGINEGMLNIAGEALRSHATIEVLSAQVILNISNPGDTSGFQPCFRLGGGQEGGVTGDSDVILITDVSTSMNWTLNSSSEGGGTETIGVVRNCDDPLLNDNSTKRISLAKCLAKNFINTILQNPTNKLGLISFNRRVNLSHALSSNNNSLISQIDSYTLADGTCVCCGVNGAYNLLNSSLNLSRRRFVVVMTDGAAYQRCTNSISSMPPSATCGGLLRQFNGTGIIGHGCGSASLCNGVDAYANFNNTIWSSNRTHVELSTNISTIGFAIGQCRNANWTLAETARAGGGVYRSSDDAATLSDIYSSFAQSILVAEPLTSVIPPTYHIAAENMQEQQVDANNTGGIVVQFNGPGYNLYFSENFDESSMDATPCVVLTRNNYSIGFLREREFIFESRLSTLTASYTTDYESVKASLNIPPEFDFGFIVRDVQGNILFRAINRKATKVHVLARDVPVEMIDSQGRVKNVIINIQVW